MRFQKQLLSGCALLMSLWMIVTMLSGCDTFQKRTRYEAQFFSLFDTVTTIVGYYPPNTKEQFTADAEQYRSHLERYHKLYNIYNEYKGITNLATVNRLAGTAPVVVPKEIMELLAFSKELYADTNGKVNIAFGAVTKLWQAARDAALENPNDAYAPPVEQLREAALHTDINDLVLDEQNSTVFFADSRLRLDVGAVAKGFAAQRALEETSAAGYGNILISVGGNVLAKGSKTGGREGWRVGVQNPQNTQENLYVLELSHTCFVTSGDYQRYFTVNGVNYHHIIHPETWMPEHTYKAVAVITKNSGVADGLSTALFNSSLEEGNIILERFPGTEVLWIFPDGSEKMTDGFSAHIKSNPSEAPLS